MLSTPVVTLLSVVVAIVRGQSNGTSPTAGVGKLTTGRSSRDDGDWYTLGEYEVQCDYMTFCDLKREYCVQQMKLCQGCELICESSNPADIEECAEYCKVFIEFQKNTSASRAPAPTVSSSNQPQHDGAQDVETQLWNLRTYVIIGSVLVVIALLVMAAICWFRRKKLAHQKRGEAEMDRNPLVDESVTFLQTRQHDAGWQI